MCQSNLNVRKWSSLNFQQTSAEIWSKYALFIPGVFGVLECWRNNVGWIVLMEWYWWNGLVGMVLEKGVAGMVLLNVFYSNLFLLLDLAGSQWADHLDLNNIQLNSIPDPFSKNQPKISLNWQWHNSKLT